MIKTRTGTVTVTDEGSIGARSRDTAPARLPRRSVLCMLSALFLASLVLRYPTTSHEIGIDSFFIHNLASLVQVQGHAAWVLNPLSFFGLYPMSYPSAAPFMLAEFSDLGGMAIEPSILILSLSYGLIGVVASFVMAREFLDNNLYALSVAFFFSLAPRFLDFTLWSMSARGLFMAILPMFVWSVIRAYRAPQPREIALSFTLFVLLGATHHLAALLLVVFGAATTGACVILILRLLRARLPNTVMSRRARRMAPYVAISIFAATSASMVVAANVLPQYAQGELVSGNSISIELANLGVSLVRSVGLALVMALGGIFVLVRRHGKGFQDAFVLLSFLGLTPTLLLRAYTGFYILPFIALLAGFAIVRLTEARRRRLRTIALIGCIVASGAVSASVLGYELEHSSVLPAATYSAATYVGFMQPHQVVLSNDGLLGIRVAALAHCAYLPVGGASTLFQSPEVLAYGFYSPAEVQGSVRGIPFGNISIDSESPFLDTSIQAEADWVSLMELSYATKSPLLTRYHPSLYLESGTSNATFTAYGNSYSSTFADSVYSGAYLIYADGSENLWYLQAPPSPGGQ